MTRDQAIEIARNSATRTSDTPFHEYQPTPEMARNWMPHEWVIEAILSASWRSMRPVAVTHEMVVEYLATNDAYWVETDEQPPQIGKWRNGTAYEATRVSLIAALKAAQSPQATPIGRVSRWGKRADGKPWMEAEFRQDGSADLPAGTPLYAAAQPQQATAQVEPVAWIDNSGHPKHLSEVQGVREQQLYGPLRPLFESPPVTHQQADIDAAVAAERERCAALCEMWNTSPWSSLAKEIRGGAEAGKPQAEPVADELGWLIEMRPSENLLWWDGGFDVSDDYPSKRLFARMVNDVNKAVRFSRREDAQCVLDAMLAVRPSPLFARASTLYSVQEHMWIAAQPQQATTVGPTAAPGQCPMCGEFRAGEVSGVSCVSTTDATLASPPNQATAPQPQQAELVDKTRETLRNQVDKIAETPVRRQASENDAEKMLRLCAEDPMWAAHAEVSKSLLVRAADEIAALRQQAAQPQQATGIDPMQNPKRPVMFMQCAPDESPAEQVLRKLAAWLGAGGYNADRVDADVFHDKIVWGVENAIREQTALKSAQPQQATDAALEAATGEPHVDGWPLWSGLPPAAPVAWLQPAMVDSHVVPGRFETCEPGDYAAFPVYRAAAPKGEA